jgi:hypothetical protein
MKGKFNMQEQQKKTPIELVERTGPEIFRFEIPGESLRGRLIAIETKDIGGKPALSYVIHDEEEDRLYTFLGTVDLNIKIHKSDVSKIIQVQYVGQDSESGQGKNPIKRFKVFGEKEK